MDRGSVDGSLVVLVVGLVLGAGDSRAAASLEVVDVYCCILA